MNLVLIGWVLISIFFASFFHQLIYSILAFKNIVKELKGKGIKVKDIPQEDYPKLIGSRAEETFQKYNSNIVNNILRKISKPALIIGTAIVIFAHFNT